MINLIGYLKKTLLILTSLFLLLFSTSKIDASEALETSTTIDYQINDVGELDALIDFTITTDSLVPTVLNYYTAVLPFNPIDQISVSYQDDNLERTVHQQSAGSDVVIKFNNTIISKLSPLEFKIRLKVEDFVEISDSKVITLPTNFSDITISKITTTYPKTWGEVVWSSIGNISSSDGTFQIIPNKETSISVVFGEGLGYSFNINKTLQNFDVNNVKYEISIPINNHYQDIVFEKISPPPSSTYIDEQGNSFLRYSVEPNNNVDVHISGYIIMNQQGGSLLNQEDLIVPIGYWEVKEDKEFLRFEIFQQNYDLNIKDKDYTYLTESEQKLFLENTYNYVINRLTLSENTETYLRAGASSVLGNVTNSSVEDYADFTIALLRQYDIPSRMVVGYIPKSSGYKDEGFYHTWVEVWDITEGKWTIWDPALEESSGKTIYKKDHLDHISFHIRELDPLSPNLSFFTEEELTITPISSFSDPVESISIKNIDASYNFISSSASLNIEITNTGNSIIQELIVPSESGRVLTSNSISLSPGESVNMKILLSDITEDFEHNLLIQYDNNFDSIQIPITVEKFWWWNYMLITISLMLFSGIILLINYLLSFKKKK